jgi:hypothetical protein
MWVSGERVIEGKERKMGEEFLKDGGRWRVKRNGWRSYLRQAVYRSVVLLEDMLGLNGERELLHRLTRKIQFLLPCALWYSVCGIKRRWNQKKKWIV